MSPPIEVLDSQQGFVDEEKLLDLTKIDPRVKGLTEYSSTPSPPGERVAADSLVPAAFLDKDGHPDYLKLILTSKVYEVVKETPITEAINLGARINAKTPWKTKILLKREDMQPVFSFKIRGAHNKIAHLSQAEREKGVVACSAGNHAQGVAMSAAALGIKSTIIMPQGTPTIKINNVERLGGEVVLHGQDFDAAKAECRRLELEKGLTNVSPFDDPYVIAGQGTIGMEIVRQCDLSKLKAIFCGVGGGGLIAGVAVYLKRIAPHVKIIGVETQDANAMKQSMQQKSRVMLNEVGLFADGAAVKQVGKETYRLCQEHVDEVVEVTTDELCSAIRDVYQDTRSIVEPAGALSLAGLKKYLLSPNRGSEGQDASGSYVAVLSGANMNFDRLRFVAERAPLGDRVEALLAVNIPEKPGAFLAMMKHILPHPVTEFSYRYAREDEADIMMSIQVKDRLKDIGDVIAALNANGMKAVDISDNELAKDHMRYLVGGCSAVPNERIYSFTFPERPNALAAFLEKLTPGLNISLFHYRNHGSDIGKILAGIQVPPDEEAQREFQRFLDEKLKYPYRDETENQVYKSFMTQVPRKKP